MWSNKFYGSVPYSQLLHVNSININKNDYLKRLIVFENKLETKLGLNVYKRYLLDGKRYRRRIES